MSIRLTVLSNDPVARYFSSLESATLFTQSNNNRMKKNYLKKYHYYYYLNEWH